VIGVGAGCGTPRRAVDNPDTAIRALSAVYTGARSAPMDQVRNAIGLLKLAQDARSSAEQELLTNSAIVVLQYLVDNQDADAEARAEFDLAPIEDPPAAPGQSEELET
jgi:hypothetical protein